MYVNNATMVKMLGLYGEIAGNENESEERRYYANIITSAITECLAIRCVDGWKDEMADEFPSRSEFLAAGLGRSASHIHNTARLAVA
jgi:hypothetical protein